MAKKNKFVDYKALKEKLEDAKESIANLEENFEEKIEDHPLQSVAIAFGVGFLSGALVYLLTRRRR
ncbi:MAG: DUF883 C-terminal domain-containing protein [Nanoarchaeota archaeon]|nr:DUF883 C-terminal domain-containing protein [Nanoarchaeota archaeon]MBU1005891.1 DUF883 C-terminal domain-containing protein [Nanoarchaeota archaeon]MBU1946530.1 DUF883 C-terminal domain-containing protein [Nanoarchaeota archaeon]